MGARKKETREWWMEKTQQEEREVTASPISYQLDPYIVFNKTLCMTPYSSIIPLNYLLMVDRYNECYRNDFVNMPHNYSAKMMPKTTLLHSLVKKSYRRNLVDAPLKSMITTIKGHLKDCLYDDEPILIENSYNTWYGILVSLGNNFCSFDHIYTWSTRTMSGVVGYMSLYKMEDCMCTPYVLPVITPENFVAMRAHFYATGKIDMSKVVILVDKDLDTPSFPNKNFRNLYRKHILPIISKEDLNVMKVSQGFIREYCFLQPFKLQNKNIVKRKKEIEELAKEFITFMKEQSIKREEGESNYTLGPGIGGIPTNMTVDSSGTYSITSPGGFSGNVTNVRVETPDVDLDSFLNAAVSEEDRIGHIAENMREYRDRATNELYPPESMGGPEPMRENRPEWTVLDVDWTHDNQENDTISLTNSIPEEDVDWIETEGRRLVEEVDNEPF